MQDQLIFNKKPSEEKNNYLPDLGFEAEKNAVPQEYLRADLNLPELSELDVVRHFVRLSQKNFSVDTHFYPLGSCTMKYNPKINEDVSLLPGFANIHPLQDESQVQGMLELLYDFEKYLCAIFGFSAFTLQPAAGAHGELASLMMIKAFHKDRNQGSRNKIIIPDSSHGTNPASVSIVGYDPVVIKSNGRGNVDIDAIKNAAGRDLAGLMLTNPNTLGLFDEHICDIAEIIHNAGGILYYDGANANANLGICRPADIGFDAAHFNLHKTFAAPHGGGGPGSGPVGVNSKLEPFLPVPRVIKDAKGFRLSSDGFLKSIGRVHGFNGNINVIIKAFSYICRLGAKGLKDASEQAVAKANYMKEKLKSHYFLPYDRTCQHEFVISAKWQKEKYGIQALDIAKRLIDYGYHPPTIYFPLIVEDSLMIEPTESESYETIDAFCEAMIAIAKECAADPSLLKNAPHGAPVSRVDETRAVREPNLRWKTAK